MCLSTKLMKRTIRGPRRYVEDWWYHKIGLWNERRRNYAKNDFISVILWRRLYYADDKSLLQQISRRSIDIVSLLLTSYIAHAVVYQWFKFIQWDEQYHFYCTSDYQRSQRKTDLAHDETSSCLKICCAGDSRITLQQIMGLMIP